MSLEATNTAPRSDVLFEGRTHLKILIGPIIVQLLLIAMHVAVHRFLAPLVEDIADHEAAEWTKLILHSVLALISLIYVVVPALRWYLTKFTLTETDVSMKWGIINRQKRQVQLRNVSQVEMDRSIITDWIFGCGTIYLHVAGNDSAVKLDDVPKVRKVLAMIDERISGNSPEVV